MAAEEPTTADRTRPRGWWHRAPRRLRRRLALVLIGVSLVSVLALGIFSYLTTRGLLSDTVQDQLSGIETARARRITDGLARLLGRVEVLAADRGLVAALSDLSAGFDELQAGGELLDPDQQRELEEYYEQEVLPELEAGGVDITLDELVPSDPATAYLQYHYLVDNPYPPDDRASLAMADDGSDYSDAHGDNHALLENLMTQGGYGDLMLVSSENDNIVYTVQKRPDFGTDVVSGPLRRTAIAQKLGQELSRAPVGDAVFIDFEPYPPAGGEPVLFVAAAVRDDTQVTGVAVVEVPVSALNAITTAEGDWEGTGLGDTGEIYVVGPDGLMRSDARLWLEDPEAYLDALADAGYPEELADTIARNGSTVLAQPVDSAAVDAAAAGEQYRGSTSNYLGRSTLTAAGPVGAPGLDWTIVADLATSEANEPLDTYLRRLIVLTLVLVAAVAAVGALLARWLARPVQPLLEGAEQVAAGDLDAELEDLGRNEYGDLGRQLNGLTADLRARRDALRAEEAGMTEALMAALPARLVQEVQRGDRTIGEVVDDATIVSVTLTGLVDQSALDPDETAEAAAQLAQRLEDLAGRFGLERVRSSVDNHLFAAGLQRPGAATEPAAEFAETLAATIVAAGAELGLELSYHAGLGTGDVLAGQLLGDQPVLGVVGDPVRSALSLDAMAQPGQVLVDEAVASALGSEWRLDPVTGLIGIGGEPVPAWLLARRRGTSIEEEPS